MNILKPSKKRTKLKQLDHRLNCSIIGTCLTLKELRKISLKVKLSGSQHIDEYDLHRVFVGIADEKSFANHYLNKFLDRKYQQTIKRFSKILGEEALTEQWVKTLATGDIAAVYWALLTHPTSSKALIDTIYGEVHMLSHISGASMRVDIHELTMLRRQNSALKTKQQETYRKNNKSLYEKDSLIRKQEKSLKKLQQEINALKVALMREPLHSDRKIQTACSLKDNLNLANGKIMRLEQKAASYQVKWESALVKQTLLEEQLGQSTGELKNVENLLESYLTKKQDKLCQTPHNCPQKDLKGKCILYVGGRNRQCSHFKQLVENSNGQFIHHDGGLSDGSNKLNSTLAQADAVMCPLDCISHEAIIKVKKHCKIAEKRLVMLPRSSLSAFSKGLSDVLN